MLRITATQLVKKSQGLSPIGFIRETFKQAPKIAPKEPLTITHIPGSTSELVSLATLSFETYGLQCFITIHENNVDLQSYQQSLHQYSQATASKANATEKEWLVDRHQCSNIWLTLSCITEDPAKVNAFINQLNTYDATHSPLAKKLDKDGHFYYTITLTREGRDTEALAGALLLTEERPIIYVPIISSSCFVSVFDCTTSFNSLHVLRRYGLTTHTAATAFVRSTNLKF